MAETPPAASPEVWFYHLVARPLEVVLPPLLEKALQREWNVVVQLGAQERVDALDEALWTYSSDSFLPHGQARDGDPEFQPIYLTTGDETPNDAQVRICAAGASARAAVAANPAHERVVLMFDGNDPEALADARAQWKSLKEAGYTLSYWQQGETGGWDRKA